MQLGTQRGHEGPQLGCGPNTDDRVPEALLCCEHIQRGVSAFLAHWFSTCCRAHVHCVPASQHLPSQDSTQTHELFLTLPTLCSPQTLYGRIIERLDDKQGRWHLSSGQMMCLHWRGLVQGLNDNCIDHMSISTAVALSSGRDAGMQ